jgi:hypothetical protein
MTRADLPTRVAQMPDAVAERAAQFMLELAMPGVRRVVIHLDTDVHVFVDPASGSWVRATPLGDGTAELVEYGHRPIWEEVCVLVNRWEQSGRPELEDR